LNARQLIDKIEGYYGKYPHSLTVKQHVLDYIQTLERRRAGSEYINSLWQQIRLNISRYAGNQPDVKQLHDIHKEHIRGWVPPPVSKLPPPEPTPGEREKVEGLFARLLKRFGRPPTAKDVESAGPMMTATEILKRREEYAPKTYKPKTLMSIDLSSMCPNQTDVFETPEEYAQRIEKKREHLAKQAEQLKSQTVPADRGPEGMA
tara:strand:- start:3376 stop:3990 length:615 start_codon:yes stop_codon:yes gene_type:complete